MGDPKRQKKKYKTPLHPWRAARIEKERDLVKSYGLKNKKEIWKFETKLRNFSRQAKNLIRNRGSKQAEIEKKQLLDRLYKIALIEREAKLEDVLGLTLESILDRRLQTMVYKRGLANSIKQARQFIVHGHIFVEGRKINAPAYVVTNNEEDKITFNMNSPLSKKDHAEIVKITNKKEAVVKEPVKVEPVKK